ncbi:MAG: CoA transferase [Chloroflexi bacterium]|nr:CoA transferase [Chloroflexota bacterium]
MTTQVPAGAGPLTGIRVCDLTFFQAGPFCSMMLADMGAEVIKVEQPGVGEPGRSVDSVLINGEPAYFFAYNRNKKSITLNLREPAAREVLDRLVLASDVVLTNQRPAAVKKLGFDYERLSRLKPDLIYCAIAAFSHTGKAANKPGLDPIIQGVAGLMSLTGEAGGEPMLSGYAVSDTAAALHAYQGILLALLARERWGIGQKVEVVMVDASLTMLQGRDQMYFGTGVAPKPSGNANRHTAPSEPFRTQDGWINVIVMDDQRFVQFCGAIEMPELASDPHFAKNEARLANRAELAKILQERFLGAPSSVWLERLEAADVVCGPINDLGQILSDPLIREREMVVEVEHPKAGPIKVLGVPVKLSATPGQVRTPPPLLGEHTDEVLASLGYRNDEIESLRRGGVL